MSPNLGLAVMNNAAKNILTLSVGCVPGTGSAGAQGMCRLGFSKFCQRCRRVPVCPSIFTVVSVLFILAHLVEC